VLAPIDKFNFVMSCFVMSCKEEMPFWLLWINQMDGSNLSLLY